MPHRIEAALPPLTIAAIFLVLAWLVLWRGPRQMRWPQHRISGIVGQRIALVTRGFAALRNGRSGAELLVLSTVIWFLSVFTFYLLMRGFNLDIPWLAAVVVMLILQVGISLPSAPASIGVYEGLVVFALSLFNVDSNVALSYALLLHAIGLVPTIIGAYFFGERGLSIAEFSHKKPYPSEQQPTPLP